MAVIAAGGVFPGTRGRVGGSPRLSRAPDMLLVMTSAGTQAMAAKSAPPTAHITVMQKRPEQEEDHRPHLSPWWLDVMR